MTLLFSNNAQTTIAGSITNIATAVALAPGSGVEFPNPGAGQTFLGTFNDAATGLLYEIVSVTARTTDTLTIVRAQESTVALAWNAGDIFGNFMTAGTASAFSQTTYAALQLAKGEVKVTYNSTTALNVLPSLGNNIMIAGVQYQVASGGFTIANTNVEVGGVAGQNLAANTTYDIYLKVSAGVLTPSYYVDAGGGTHVTDTTAGNVGVEVHTGPDSTRSLIGKCRTSGASQFLSSTVGGLINWFPSARRSLGFSGSGTGAATTTSGSPTEITSASRLVILSWADEAVTGLVNGNSFSTNTTTNSTYVGVDGSTATSGTDGSCTVSSTVIGAAVGTMNQILTEGQHTLSPFGATGSGTATWNVLLTVNVRG